MPKGRRKPQGKLDVNKVLQGVQAGMKKKDIAGMAGSMAKSDQAKINAVGRIMKSDEFKKKAHKLIERSYEGITQDKIDRANYSALVKGIEQMSKVAGLAEAQQVEINNTQVNVTIEEIINHYAEQGVPTKDDPIDTEAM